MSTEFSGVAFGIFKDEVWIVEVGLVFSKIYATPMKTSTHSK